MRQGFNCDPHHDREPWHRFVEAALRSPALPHVMAKLPAGTSLEDAVCSIADNLMTEWRKRADGQNAQLFAWIERELCDVAPVEVPLDEPPLTPREPDSVPPLDIELVERMAEYVGSPEPVGGSDGE